MNTYLVVCGVILNIVVLLTVIYCVFDEIRVRKANKRIRAEQAQTQEQFEKELVLAKQEWLEWVEERKKIIREYQQESNSYKKLFLDSRLLCHSINADYWFASIGKRIPFSELSDRYNWILENSNLN